MGQRLWDSQDGRILELLAQAFDGRRDFPFQSISGFDANVSVGCFVRGDQGAELLAWGLYQRLKAFFFFFFNCYCFDDQLDPSSFFVGP